MTTETKHGKESKPRATRAKSRKGMHLSTREKAEAIALWKAGNTTIKELCDKFDRNPSTFFALFKAEGVTKGEAREEHEQKIAAAVEKAAMADVTVTASRIQETKDEHYKMASAIARATWKLLATATKENRAVGTATGDLKALQIAAQTLKTVREERYAVLGISVDQMAEELKMPDLVIKELTADEVKALSSAQLNVNELDSLGGEGSGALESL